jgi:hypothetical protein
MADSYEQIVRDLANGFSLCDDDRCHWCRATFPRPAGAVVGIQHKPDCLIQRARDFVDQTNGPRNIPCAFCGRVPASGFAMIENNRYCHGWLPDTATCYELAQRGGVKR